MIALPMTVGWDSSAKLKHGFVDAKASTCRQPLIEQAQYLTIQIIYRKSI